MSNWRELTTRLVADTTVLAGALQPDEPMPTPDEAAELLIGVDHLIAQLTRASIGIGRVYGRNLPEGTLDEFRQAVQHMQAITLAPVAEALSRQQYSSEVQQPQRP